MALLPLMLGMKIAKSVTKGVRKHFSHDERDEQLSSLHDRALADAKSAEARGDPRAAAYYHQLARRYGLQRLQEAEHKAVGEVQQAKAAGKKKAVKAAEAKVQEIRQRMLTEYGVHSDDTGLDGLPMVEAYQPYQPQVVKEGEPAPPPYPGPAGR